MFEPNCSNNSNYSNAYKDAEEFFADISADGRLWTKIVIAVLLCGFLLNSSCATMIANLMRQDRVNYKRFMFVFNLLFVDAVILFALLIISSYLLGNGASLFLPQTLDDMINPYEMQIVLGFLLGSYYGLILSCASVTVIQYLAVNRPFHYALKLTRRKTLCIVIVIDCFSFICTLIMTIIPVIYRDCFFDKICMGLQVGINLPLIIAILLAQNYCYWKIFFGLRKHREFRNQSTVKSSAANSIKQLPMKKRISDDHREFLSTMGWNVVVFTLCAIPIVAIWAIYIRFLFEIPTRSSICDTLATQMERLFTNNLKRELRTLMILTPCLYIRTILGPLFAVYKNTKVKHCAMGFLCRKNATVDINEVATTQQATTLES